MNTEAISKQVEFYFSDSNFRKDMFLRATAEKDSEGFISIDTLLTFNKLKFLTSNTEDVATAVKDSENIVVSDDKLKLRRKLQLPSNDTSKERTVYVKGYPVDGSVTIETIENQFSEYGKVLMVRLRREPGEEKRFKGSAFVEFNSEEEMAKAVAGANQGVKAEDKPDIPVISMEYNGEKLACVIPFLQWIKAKNDKKDKSKGNSTHSVGNKRKMENSCDDDEEVDTADSKDKEFEKNLILSVTGLPEGNKYTLYQLKDSFKAKGNVKYVDFNEGETTCFVRTADAEAATAIKTAIEENSIELPVDEGDVKATLGVTIVTGDEETAYWDKIINASAGSNKGGRSGRGGRGGRGGGRSGRGGGKRRRF